MKPADKAHALAASLEGPANNGDAGALGPPDERVLGDIAHEMGNHLHKLYYWTDYLRAQVAGRGEPETAAVEMLAGAVERLENFMRMILEYFAPARLCFTKVKVADLVDGLAARLPGRRLHLEGFDVYGETTVFADAGLLAHAVRTVFERAASTLVAEDEMVVKVTGASRREYRGVEVEFCGGASTSAGRLKNGIDMAVAEKFLLMHGAELSEREATTPSLVVFLPLYT